MTTHPGRLPIEQRLAAAGLPALPRNAWLEIDLDALRGNLGVLRELAGPGVPVRPVVKADAYGHGAIPVALALEAAGVDGLCVAAFDEALELRDGGVRVPILVLYPVPTSLLADAARLGISVAGGDGPVLAEIVRAASGLDPGRPLAIELEVETGLGRGGVDAADLVASARLASTSPGVVLAGLWTHFQAVEDVANRTAQVARFEAAVQAVTAAGIALPARHAAASAGTLSDGLLAYDGIRPGLAIYGLVPDELEPAMVATSIVTRLRPVMSLIARPVRIADLPAGWGISYGPTFRTTRPSRIATLPLGYGDGWSRALSNRASAIVRGRRVPLVGNVAMDAVMADVSDLPGPPVDCDDEFTLIGGDGTERITAADLARERTTNTWEVVTAMSRRLPRVYHAAARPVGLRTLTEGRV
ncbi:MAG: alanine racemase [Chloroflexota bacterium]|nr:alanine racemase [Chloroflexota bacterium]